jgi:GxxExxY protein
VAFVLFYVFPLENNELILLSKLIQMHENEITEKIIGCAIEVHKALGPGLLEKTYQECLFYELGKLGLRVKKEFALPVSYKEISLDIGYRIDLLVEEKVIVEIKAIDAVHGIHLAQVLTYLKMSGHKVGLLLNFNVVKLTDGIKRVVNNL